MNDGPAVGESRRIIANTTDTLTVAAFTTPPTVGGGDSYGLHGVWTRLTIEAQDIINSIVDYDASFPIPGDRTRFKSTLSDFELIFIQQILNFIKGIRMNMPAVFFLEILSENIS